jgi:hypothetical protein
MQKQNYNFYSNFMIYELVRKSFREIFKSEIQFLFSLFSAE